MNPYTQGNPYLSQLSDIGYAQQQYQPQMQNTGMQDTFQNQALQTMQNQAAQAGQRQSSAGGVNPLQLAQALRGMGSGQSPQGSWGDTGQWQGGTGYAQGTSLNAPQLAGESMGYIPMQPL
jgi:hypothetical protein